jgi:hypothetical protein
LVRARIDVSTKDAIAQRLLDQMSRTKSPADSDVALSALSILPALYSDQLKSEVAIKAELLRRIGEEGDPPARVVAIAAISQLATSDTTFQAEAFKKLTDKGEAALDRAAGGGRASAQNGIQFSALRAEFTQQSGTLSIRQGVVKGPTIALTIEGNIDYNANQIRRSGTVVPLYGLKTCSARFRWSVFSRRGE